MKKVKIAQIGTSTNSHGNSIWKNLLKQSDIFEVVGYAFPENEREKFPKRAEAFEGYREMTVEEILNDAEIEAVAVETEEIYLTKYALMAAKAGKQIFLEKPAAVTPEELDELTRVLEEYKTKSVMGLVLRFNPLSIMQKRLIADGELGNVFLANVDY